MKKNKKENNNLLKTLCVVVFVFMLIAALFSQNLQQSQSVASSPFAPLFKFFTYAPQKSVQIGWFTVFYPTATPAPTKMPVTPTPCPGGTHEQSVAYVPQQPIPPVNNQPPIYITQTIPSPTQKIDPCISPQP